MFLSKITCMSARRVFRRLFQVATLLSAIGLVCVLVIWPLSYFREGMVLSESPWGYLEMFGLPGRLMVITGGRRSAAHIEFHNKEADFDYVHAKWSYFVWRPSKEQGIGSQYLGVFVFFTPNNDGTFNGALWIVPLSYLGMLFSILPVLAYFRYRRRRASAGPAFPIEPSSFTRKT